MGDLTENVPFKCFKIAQMFSEIINFYASLWCVLFYSALLEKTYSASFVSPLYLKNSPGRIIFEKLNLVKKESPKNVSTPLFFSSGSVII